METELHNSRETTNFFCFAARKSLHLECEGHHNYRSAKSQDYWAERSFRYDGKSNAFRHARCKTSSPAKTKENRSFPRICAVLFSMKFHHFPPRVQSDTRRGLLDWPRTGDEDVHESPGALPASRDRKPRGKRQSALGVDRMARDLCVCLRSDGALHQRINRSLDLSP